MKSLWQMLARAVVGLSILLTVTTTGCDEGVLIVKLTKVPAETHSIELSVTLQPKGSLDQVPQEDVFLEGAFDELIGLRYPAGDISIARVNAKALNPDNLCIAKDLQTIDFAGPGKHYVSIDFQLTTLCD